MGPAAFHDWCWASGACVACVACQHTSEVPQTMVLVEDPGVCPQANKRLCTNMPAQLNLQGYG